MLGGFWQTWALSAVLFAAAPISYGPTIGDYTRRISALRFSNRRICGALGVGMFVGVLLPSLFGAFTAMSFANPTDSYLDDLVAASPGWYVLPIVVISLLGGLSQGVLCVYASGLDLEGLAPRLKRTQTTIITAAVAIALLYLGVFVFDAVESVTARTVGGLFGLLAVNTTLYVGPLADIAGGVDVSTIGSAALAGLIYLASPSVIKE